MSEMFMLPLRSFCRGKQNLLRALSAPPNLWDFSPCQKGENEAEVLSGPTTVILQPERTISRVPLMADRKPRMYACLSVWGGNKI